MLAARLGGRLVPEVARDYLSGRDAYTEEDLLEIARRQAALEAEALAAQALTAGGALIVCDTDLLVIQVWWEEKYGEVPEELARLQRAGADRAYLLLSPDIAWAADPLRENPHDRHRLHLRHRALLAAGPHPYREIGGEWEAREDAALSAVRALFPDRLGE